MVINKNPQAAVTEQFDLQGFTPTGQAQFWQYGEAQDNAQNQSSTGAASLANFTAPITVSGGNFSYALPAYSMTVIDLTPNVTFAVQTGSTLNINLGSTGAVAVAAVGPLILATQNSVQVNFSGVTSIVLSDTGTGSVLNFNGVSVPIDLSSAANTVINVNSGVMTIAAPAGGSVSLGTLSVANGASAVLTAPTSSQPATLNLTNLSIAPTGKFDIGTNIVYINYGTGSDPISTIAGYLKSGFNAGAWTGFGVYSSVAATHPAYGVGYADSADAGNPAGLPAGTIKIMYTLLGDADLNGVVNGIDFGIVAANFNASVAGWDQGDFDYDNVVNGIDFASLSANFNQGVNIAAGASAPASTRARSPSSPSTANTATNKLGKLSTTRTRKHR
jgi:hypothetical protein